MADEDKPIVPGESREYTERYRTQESAWSNQGSETDEREIFEHEQELEAKQKAFEIEAENASSRSFIWPKVGKFIVPVENTFAAHLQLVQGGKDVDLEFDPKTYAYFDKVLAGHANRPDIFDPSHADYARFRAVRDNLAVLRNDIMGYYMDDSSFDPGDEIFLPKLTEIAATLGKAMSNDGWMKGLLTPSLNVNHLNVEGEGAAHAYRFLLKEQRSPMFFRGFQREVRKLLGLPDKRWELPPIEDTPFGFLALNAPPPPDLLCMSHDEYKVRCYQRQLMWEYAQASAPEKFENTELQAVPEAFREPVDVLKDQQKRESVEYGKIILRWLRKLQLQKDSVEEWVDTGAPKTEAQTEEQNNIRRIVSTFEQLLNKLKVTRPDIEQESEAIREASDAAKVFKHALDLKAAKEISHSIAQSQQISAEASHEPERWNDLKQKGKDQLLESMEKGFEETVNALEQQQQEIQSKCEEMADMAMEAMMVASDAQKRRRRRRSGNISSATARAKRVQKDITADDKILGQGAYAAQNQREAQRNNAAQQFQHQAGSAGLDADAIALARRQARTLLNANSTAKSLPKNVQAVANVNPNDKIAPDDQTVLARTQQQQERERQNRRNNLTQM